MYKILSDIEHYYNLLKTCTSTSGRASNGYKIIAIIKENPQVKKYWEYLPNEFYWIDRFKKIEKYVQPLYEAPPIFQDEATNLRTAPECCGLYFIGETHFNPFTDEKFYCVKIGLSNNIKKRMNGYRSCTSMVYPIEFLETYDYINLEHYYHNLLNQIAIYRNQNNDEYWFVDKETYLQMCQQGFDYFK